MFFFTVGPDYCSFNFRYILVVTLICDVFVRRMLRNPMHNARVNLLEVTKGV